MAQRPRRSPAKEHLVDPDHQRAGVEALGHPRLEVARAIELVVQPALPERRWIRGELLAGAAAFQRLARRLGGQHAGLDGAVAALDARGVEKSGVVADQRAA